MDTLGPCWVDPSLSVNRKNYARGFWRNPATGRVYTFAHTASLAQALGRDLRPGFHGAHKCGNPPCWNPAHLYEARPMENEADKKASQPPRAVEWRIWPRQAVRKHGAVVPQIRALRAEGWAIKAIARHLGLAVTTVADIAHGRTWKAAA